MNQKKEVNSSGRSLFGGSLFGTLQKIGQSLMVPVSVLPAAGLLVALGRIFQNNGTDLAKDHIVNLLGNLFYSGGLAIFEQLPVVFAIGVAIGFTGGAGVAGLAATVGFFTLKNVLGVMTQTRGLSLPIDTGVFGGIIVGLLTAQVYARFHQTKLHPVFGFFSGKRLVPILTAAMSLGLGILLGYAWPPVQAGIKEFGEFVVNSSLGPAFYAAGKRLLIPVGLHHVYYPSFLYEFGEFLSKATGSATPHMVHGDSARYFAGDPSAGRFMAAEFPIMLFGLPAACLAMYLRAPKAKRAAIGGVMLSAALTSIVTGITEPIEFAFIFVAPILFVFHVMAAFLSGFLTGLFDIHLGYTFSASIIDFVLGFFNQKNSMYLWLVVGPAICALYFSVFYFAIGILNLKTPGRESADEEASLVEMGGKAETVVGAKDGDSRPHQILAALGGSINLIQLDACITRLRIRVKNDKSVSIPKLKALGAVGVMNVGGGSLQVIFGTESDRIKDQIKAIIEGGQVLQTSPAKSGSTEILSTVRISAPIKGRCVSLNEVPDEVFSKRMMGEGFAIIPEDGFVRAPFDGEIAQMFKTGHAVGLIGPSGTELLIHVGIDTVKLGGKGFKTLVVNGQKVRKGDLLIEFDLNFISQSAKSIYSPVVLTNTDQFKSVKIELGAQGQGTILIN